MGIAVVFLAHPCIVLLANKSFLGCRMYVNQNFQTFPEASNLKCKETIRPGVFYKFVVTRSAGGVLALYLNGYPCDKGTLCCTDQISDSV